MRERDELESDPLAARLRRRSLLAGGAAIAGVALLRSEPAAAATGNLQFGLVNDADNSGTQLTSSAGSATFTGTNSGTNGTGLRGEVTDAANPAHGVVGHTVGTGHAIIGTVFNAVSANAAVAGTHNGNGAGAVFVQTNAAGNTSGVIGQTAGSGAGVVGFSYGTGIGVLGTSATDAPGVRGMNSTTGPAIQGVNSSTGVGVWGASTSGRGGHFAGAKAQVRLVPAAGNHPAAGKAGDLFVDSSKRLWFCRGGNVWTQLA